MSKLEGAILKEFTKEDKEDTGEITVLQAEAAFNRCKALSLTPFQIHTLLGISDCDGDGLIDYKVFAKIASDFISDNFSFETMCKKQQIFEISQKKNPAKDRTHPVSQNMD